MVEKPGVLNILKPAGLTPLQTLDLLRQKYPELENEKLAYAGRLDPLATGVMLVLAGEEIKNKNQYLNLDKIYRFKILLGFTTDTGDCLGKVTGSAEVPEINVGQIETVLPSYIGKFNQEYPKYSTPIIAGKESFSKEVEIYSFEYLGQEQITGQELLQNIQEKIKKVSGDFRQTEILNIWNNYLGARLPSKSFQVIEMETKVSSGTYIRVLAQKVGQDLGLPALAYEIIRTAVGDFKIMDSIIVD